MNLISGEAVNNLEKSDTKGSDYDRGWNDALCAVDMLPSAFEGMTNGEVIQAVFDVMVLTIKDGKVWVERIFFPFDEVWWNAPYKAESEDEE